MPYISHMDGKQLIKKLRKLGRERGIVVTHDSAHGKGSHSTVVFGDCQTTIPSLKRDIPPGLFSAILRQLGLTREDLD